jgi:hypothetical protein
MIPEHEWLSKAKTLAVGMRTRVHHLHESRPNMAIGNDPDKWWCYCHACHEGAVIEKSHVLLGEHNVVHDSTLLPNDIEWVFMSDFEVPIARFLADKNMSDVYLPAMHYSASRKRLMLHLEGKWHGRDLTGRSPQKWMNYNNAAMVGHPFTYTVVTEDLFSMFKTRWAMRQYPNVGVVCNLGTNASRHMVYALSQNHSVRKVAWFFDADRAGDSGAKANTLRNAPYSFEQCRPRPPEGLDPKDMTCSNIRELLVKEMRL